MSTLGQVASPRTTTIGCACASVANAEVTATMPASVRQRRFMARLSRAQAAGPANRPPGKCRKYRSRSARAPSWSPSRLRAEARPHSARSWMFRALALAAGKGGPAAHRRSPASLLASARWQRAARRARRVARHGWAATRVEPVQERQRFVPLPEGSSASMRSMVASESSAPLGNRSACCASNASAVRAS
jgi:hypothetical protein